MLSHVFQVLVILQALLFGMSSTDSSNIGRPYSVVLVGGGESAIKSIPYSDFISLSGGVGNARVGVIVAASADPCCGPQSSWVYYNNVFKAYGAAEVYYVPITVDGKANNSDPSVIAKIRTMTGFFFGGGDQMRIAYSLFNEPNHVPSPALIAMKETLLATGGAVGGTSAGTDCQTSKTMITNGQSYEALVTGAQIEWHYPSERVHQLSAYGLGGIGFFHESLLDTHFANRGRQGRFLELIVDSTALNSGSVRGIGIDENTALVITGPWNHRVGKVVGERGITVIDISYMKVTSNDGSVKMAHSKMIGARISRMSTGDSLDLNCFKVTPATFKTPTAGREQQDVAASSNDIFNEGNFEFDKIAQSLFTSKASSTYGLTVQTTPTQIRVEIGKNWEDLALALDNALPTTSAAGYDGIDPSTGIYAYSYTDMWMNVMSEK